MNFLSSFSFSKEFLVINDSLAIAIVMALLLIFFVTNTSSFFNNIFNAQKAILRNDFATNLSNSINNLDTLKDVVLLTTSSYDTPPFTPKLPALSKTLFPSISEEQALPPMTPEEEDFFTQVRLLLEHEADVRRMFPSQFENDEHIEDSLYLGNSFDHTSDYDVLIDHTIDEIITDLLSDDSLEG
jgi:uncharacterized protein YejL (UPF0352 family)